MPLPFWPFRKPKTKLELISDALHSVVAGAHAKIEDLPLDRAAHKLRDARHSAGKIAAHGWEATTHKTGDVLHTASDVLHGAASAVVTGASAVASGASHVVEAIGEKASDVTHSVTDNVFPAIGEAKDTVAHSVSSVVENAGAKAAKLKRNATHVAAETAHASRESAKSVGLKAAKATTALIAAPAALLDKVHEHKEAATVEAAEVGEKAAKKKTRALRIGKNHLDSYEPAFEDTRHADVRHVDVRMEENTSKWLWIGVGLLVGAMLALLLAPASGRRARAALRDKAAKAKRGTTNIGKTAKSRVINLSNQVGGKLQERRHAGDEDYADDITIADRVRTTLGENPVTRNLERINVDSVDGIVTLRGPIVERELKVQIEEIVRAVKGVVEVRSDLLVADAPEDEATFVG